LMPTPAARTAMLSGRQCVVFIGYVWMVVFVSLV
jgi:hypothetical protein